MRLLTLYLLVSSVSLVLADDPSHTEQEIQDAFRAAYSNRSQEIGEFFNKTFGPGGDAEEIGQRFKTAWRDASDGVRQFVNETYWNISRTLGEPSETEREAMLSSYPSAERSKEGSKPKKPKPEPQDDQKSILDTAWNYFKSVFGVSPAKPNSEPASAGSPMSHKAHNGLFLGLLTLLAGMSLLLQAGVNRNSWINKTAMAASRDSAPPGYVRLV